MPPQPTLQLWQLLLPSGEVATLPLPGSVEGEKYTLGRKDCHVTLPDKAVSKKHATLQLTGMQQQVLMPSVYLRAIQLPLRDLSAFT
eukprot:4694492-Pleurochrysis_carterae.AAC.3